MHKYIFKFFITYFLCLNNIILKFSNYYKINHKLFEFNVNKIFYIYQHYINHPVL